MTLAKSEQRRDDPSPAHVPGVTSRRAFMNSIVALPIAAALPVAAPAMPSNVIATDRRALEAYASWLFMERRILCGELWPHMGAEAERYDWHDNAGAGWHFHRGDLAWDEGPQPSSRAAAVLDLVGVDWRQPKRDLGLNHEDNGERPPLPTGWPHPDGRLLTLAEEYIVAEKKWCDLNSKVDNMEGDIHRGPVPSVLHRRETDDELGLPPIYAKPDDHPQIWDRPIDIDHLRETKWWATTAVRTDDEFSACSRAFVPSDAARARADEIIAVYDLWRGEKLKGPRGYKTACREKNRAEREYMRIEKEIQNTRATTIEGLMAKVRCAHAYAKSNETTEFESGSCDEVMAVSIFRDIEHLAKVA
jgi:hypothetical protein